MSKLFHRSFAIVLFCFTGLAIAEDQVYWSVPKLLTNQSQLIGLSKDGVVLERFSKMSVQRIDDVTGRLAAAFEIQKPAIFIVKESSPNAFVTIGKNGPVMMVGTEMLKLVGDDHDMLATVIGHELGHLKANHLTNKRTSTELVNFLGLLIGKAIDIDQANKGNDTGGLGVVLGSTGAGLVNAKFSRDQEREADALGIDRMARAGFNPKATPRLWQAMEQKGGGGSGVWMSSHPSSSERFEVLQKAAAELGPVYLANRQVPGALALAVASPTPTNQITASDAITTLMREAEQGSAVAQRQLGARFLNGTGGIPKDEVEAEKWLRKGALQGDASAQVSLGFLYETGGAGLPKDNAEALSWYQKAAEQGNGIGQSNLGLMYMAGRGTPVNLAEGISWLKKSSDQGVSAGQFHYGNALMSGRGVAQDMAEGVKLVRAAADQGFDRAMMAMGSFYKSGRGVPISEPESMAWYKKAAAKGYQPAVDALSKAAQNPVPPQSVMAASPQAATSSPMQQSNASVIAPSSGKTIEQRLLELKSLRDKGLITQTDFDQKSAEILKSL